MSRDYIPDPDSEFYTWEQTFMTYAAANTVAIGLAVGDLTAVTSAQGEFEPAYLDNDIKQNAARAARQLKDEKRAYFEKCIRELVRKLQANKLCSNDEKQALGITVRDGIMTPAASAATRPVLQADTSEPGRLTVAFADEGTPTKKAKPAGVTACLLQVKKGGAAPACDADWHFLGLDSATPYLAAFDSADAGAPVWIRGCWVNSRQEQGPWSSDTEHPRARLTPRRPPAPDFPPLLRTVVFNTKAGAGTPLRGSTDRV